MDTMYKNTACNNRRQAVWSTEPAAELTAEAVFEQLQKDIERYNAEAAAALGTEA